jgi:hypothetical protein
VPDNREGVRSCETEVGPKSALGRRRTVADHDAQWTGVQRIWPIISLPHATPATSTQAARARNTSNGKDDWKDHTLSLDDMAQSVTAFNVTMGVELNCPHARRFIPCSELLEDVAEGRVRKF